MSALTRAQIAALTPEQLRLAVAELMGWRKLDSEKWYHPDSHIKYGTFDLPPNYPAEIAAAWLVHRRMISQPVVIHHRYMDGLKEALIYRTDQRGMTWTMVLDLIEPQDFCRAALLATVTE